MSGSIADDAVPENARRAEALALIRAEADDITAINRLCRAAVRALGVSGAVATIATPDGRTAGASDENALRIGEIEFTTGEGPSGLVLGTRRQLLVPDLGAPTAPRWPAYTPAARALGVTGLFAFPLHVGAVQLGVLIVVTRDHDPLDPGRVGVALTFAELATETLLDGSVGGDGGSPGLDMDSLLDAHAEVYQAQGMIMIQLGIGLADALARLRARAFVEGRDLAELARDVLEGREHFDGDG